MVPIPIICARAIDAVALPGMRFDLKCGACQTNVALMPSDQRILEVLPDTEIVCEKCLDRQADEMHDAVHAAIDEMEREAKGGKNG